MSLLMLNEESRARARAVALYAEQPEHWYCPNGGGAPGDGEPHTVRLGSYRCVFSWTFHEGVLFRHLSISVREGEGGALPNPVAAFTLASWFGFTGGEAAPGELVIGPGRDWQVEQGSVPFAHLILAQRIGEGADA